MMDKPLLFDGFCCGGGIGAGYERAGWHTVGCDIDAKALHYNPHECYQGDVLAVLDTLLDGGMWHDYRLNDFQAIHCSPPCQDYARSRCITHPNGRHNGAVYPRLIAPVRERLIASRLPWIIENVGDAYPDMPDAIMLCGTSFGLRVWRHRLFSSSHLLYAAGPCHHQVGDVSVRRKHGEYIGIGSGVTYQDARGYTRKRPKTAPADVCKAAMGIDWLPMQYLGEAIPPAYSHWLGAQLLCAIGTDSEVA